MTWVILLLGCLIAYVITCFVIAATFIKLAFHPSGKRRRSYETVQAYETRVHGIDFEVFEAWSQTKFTIDVGENTVLACRFLPAPNTIHPPRTVVIAHGFTQNMMNSIRYAQLFRELGCSVLLYDHRAFGESTGTYNTLGVQECRDLQAVLAWVTATQGDEGLLVVHGESMGAVTALLSLATSSHVDGVIADCAISRMRDYVSLVMKRTVHMPPALIVWMVQLLSKRYNAAIFANNPIEAVATSHTPILFIHGKQDSDVPYTMSEDMAHVAIHPLSQLAVFEGADHARSYLRDKARYTAVVSAFVDSVASQKQQEG